MVKPIGTLQNLISARISKLLVPVKGSTDHP
jgi:hypothetical protein